MRQRASSTPTKKSAAMFSHSPSTNSRKRSSKNFHAREHYIIHFLCVQAMSMFLPFIKERYRLFRRREFRQQGSPPATKLASDQDQLWVGMGSTCRFTDETSSGRRHSQFPARTAASHCGIGWTYSITGYHGCVGHRGTD
ncbi:hypothetical protein BKA82DRAFT_308363 [Pisolithus tinctorius]|uniref:Uncharacterized protein n=1 Tax=Pisolithus tinctorius Marx 270 TaxID=870435 RepID=A0A0C3P727_PISTI|nr:hypothetical protein BKA82DRAFT_308363 [Pisolithus tinctorius]KIO09180.1 hypothetical protein M404DRAFT_308363 [Pisolithus tinctorius Marx 270]